MLRHRYTIRWHATPCLKRAISRHSRVVPLHEYAPNGKHHSQIRSCARSMPSWSKDDSECTSESPPCEEAAADSGGSLLVAPRNMLHACANIRSSRAGQSLSCSSFKSRAESQSEHTPVFSCNQRSGQRNCPQYWQWAQVDWFWRKTDRACLVAIFLWSDFVLMVRAKMAAVERVPVNTNVVHWL